MLILMAFIQNGSEIMIIVSLWFCISCICLQNGISFVSKKGVAPYLPFFFFFF